MTNSKIETDFPTRGVAGGWRDPWEEPDDHAQLRAQAEAAERQQTRRTEVLGVVWQGEILEEQIRKHCGRRGSQLPRRSGLPTL